MRELSLHIMDIAENGIAAGASRIDISVVEDTEANRMTIAVGDNGRGMSPEVLERATNPFYTTRKTRRVGLGLSLFKEAARRCEGEVEITSRVGEGTRVRASFRLDHIDLAPLGDMGGALTALIMGNPEVDFTYVHRVEGRTFELDTREIRRQLEDVSLGHPQVLTHLAGMLRESLRDLGRKAP